MSKKVEVYWNLHRKCWSLRSGGKVVSHETSVVIHGGELVVRPAGRKRVLREGKKNVHAFVRGNLHLTRPCTVIPNISMFWEEVTYNPYKHETFVDRLHGHPRYRGRAVIMSKRDGKPVVWIKKEYPDAETNTG